MYSILQFKIIFLNNLFPVWYACVENFHDLKQTTKKPQTNAQNP